jgi:regulator of sirC expression with transglutaminase-like and TPR domain
VDSIEAVWRHWLERHGEEPPLDEALHRISLEEGSTRPFTEIRQQLDDLAAGLSVEDEVDLTLARLVHRLFVEHGFRGDDQEYDHPQNSRLDKVLERKRGLPILLSAVTLEVARRIGLPLTGVGFPGHFLVGTTREPRIFLDPFHAGRERRAAELAEQLEASAGPLSGATLRQALAPTPTRDLLLRVSTNLMGSWLRRKEPARALLNADRRVALRPEMPELLRDRGWLRAQVGQIELASFDLASYLESRPEAPDATRIRWALSTLLSGVGR